MIIVKEVIVFSAFVSLSISCYTAWYSGTDYVVTFCKGIHNCRVPYKAPAPVPRVQGQTIRPSSIPLQANRVQDRRETNACQWPFEDGVDGWMSGEVACVLNAGEAMKKPQPVNKLTTVAFRAFKNFGTSLEGNCNLELIRLQGVPTLAIGKAFNQATVWLFCLVSGSKG